MSIPLVAAAVLAALLGTVHSYLGERFILLPLFRRHPLPDFVRRTLRLAWHVTTVLAFGFTGLLLVMALPDREATRTMAGIISATFALSGVVSLVISRGRHLSWIVFFAIGALVWFGQP